MKSRREPGTNDGPSVGFRRGNVWRGVEHEHAGSGDPPAARASRRKNRAQACKEERPLPIPACWAGFSAFPGDATTGWHHHGDYATYAYVTEGRMTVDYGPGGAEAVEVGAGDFVYIPAHFVHRESVSHEGGSGVIVRVGGEGPTVFNVDGPDTD